MLYVCPALHHHGDDGLHLLSVLGLTRIASCAWNAECSRGEALAAEPCKARLLEAFTNNDSEAVVLDTARVDACVAALRDGTDSLAFREAALARCENILHGTLSVGSPCADENECELGAYCDLTACPGECVLLDPEQPPLQLGAPCDSAVERCEAALTCDPVTLTCRNFRDGYRMSAVGEHCSEQDHCELGLYCDESDSVCRAQPGAGETCEYGYCEPGLHCEDACTGRRPLGAACEVGYQCVTGSCQAGVCKEQGLLGSSCAADHECHSYYCGEGVCAKQPQCYGLTSTSEPSGTTVGSVSTAPSGSASAPLGPGSTSGR